jgi:type II secretory pathway component GspD/PulD (secretin)
MIFMDVHPVVKNVIGYTDAPPQPILSIREALTNVVMQDGTTLVIGGLKGNNINNKRSETPYLARIPLIGLLFQQRNDSTQKADLLFLPSPRLLTPELMKQVIAQNQKLLEPPKEIAKDKMMTEMDSETPKSETKKR